MPAMYELAVLGAPTSDQVTDLEANLARAVQAFGLRLGHEIGWSVRSPDFRPSQRKSTAVVFFGSTNADTRGLDALVKHAIPVLPVVSDIGRVHEELPEVLKNINCLDYRAGGAQRVATCLLECAGLLPRQRSVFLSYRRDEARLAALQLFNAFSARHFDVFLDTHGIAPSQDFQALLWHRLCDSDVLVMLDTPNYFASRWTSAEFGRALAKNIAVLRVGWPGTTPSARTATASVVELSPMEISAATGCLADAAIERLCLQLEAVRSESHAVRNVNLISQLRNQVERIKGQILGIGPHKAVFLRLADGKDVVLYPTLGIPTSLSLHEAVLRSVDRPVAVVYDHIGMHPDWLQHLDWLGAQVRAARWVKACEAAWQLADWEA